MRKGGRVTVHHEKERPGKGFTMRKSDGVRVRYKKMQWGKILQ